MWSVVVQALALARSIYPGNIDGAGGGRIGEYHGPYADGGIWADAYKHAAHLVSQMTVEEKVSDSRASALTSRSISPLPSSGLVKPIRVECLDLTYLVYASMMAVSILVAILLPRG